MRLAVFDFDGTIYRGETVRLFLAELGGKGRRRDVGRYYIAQAPAYALYKLGVMRLRMMGRAMRGLAALLAGMPAEELDSFFRRCADEARSGFRPEILARLRSHLAEGDWVVILSGAFARFLTLVADDLGVRTALGTGIEVVDSRCTGRIEGHLIGPAKARALQAFLDERRKEGLQFNLSQAYAYADGAQDLPLLSLVGHPVAVAPDRSLARMARRREWEVIAAAK